MMFVSVLFLFRIDIEFFLHIVNLDKKKWYLKKKPSGKSYCDSFKSGHVGAEFAFM